MEGAIAVISTKLWLFSNPTPVNREIEPNNFVQSFTQMNYLLSECYWI